MNFLLADASNWQDSLAESLTQLMTKMAAFIPNLVGMLIILILGFIIAKVLQKLATAVFKRLRFDVASEKAGLKQTMEKVGIKLTASQVVGKLIFWLVMLTFLITAAGALGLENVSHTIDSFVDYLPNVIGAAIIVVVGLLLAGFVRKLVEGSADRVGIDYAHALGKVVYGVLVVLITSLAIGQLKIETGLLNRVIEIVLIAAGAAVAISLGFGTRDIAKNVVAGIYARDVFKPGSNVAVGDDHGTLESVGTVNARIKVADNIFVHIPNSQLVDTLVREETGGNDEAAGASKD